MSQFQLPYLPPKGQKGKPQLEEVVKIKDSGHSEEGMPADRACFGVKKTKRSGYMRGTGNGWIPYPYDR